MFVKKLVEKASISNKKQLGGNLNGLRSNDVNPRIVFHYGIPSGSVKMAYDSVQKILAISTKDGRIKLLGLDNTQALLQSDDTVPSKFLQFIENQGILLNVTVKNHIEVWDVDRKQLSHVHISKEEITSFTVIQHSFYMYVGDSHGNVSVFKIDQGTNHLVHMEYNIPLSASHGNTSEVEGDTAVMYISPQPLAESKRVLVIFRDGLIILWETEESKVIFITGGSMLHTLVHETKKVTAACWACPFGSKVVVGYSNGEIFFWSIPPLSNPKSGLAADKEDLSPIQNVPISKLNLGYKMEKIPISSLKWVYGDGKASRLYVNGESGSVSSNLFQIILLSEQAESRTIKLVLPLPEPCLDLQIMTSSSDQNKQKHVSLLLLLKSGHLQAYDESMIEKYLLQSQSKSPPSLPDQILVKLPFSDLSITVAKLITDDPNLLGVMDEDYNSLVKSVPPILPIETKEKDGGHVSSAQFSGFSKAKNLYITGHSDGTITFWDLSYPVPRPLSSVKQQSENDQSVSGIPVTALYIDISSRILVSGDQSGMIRIIKLKPESFSQHGSKKKGSCNIVYSIKLIKVNGAVLCFNINRRSGHLAVGSDQGYVSVIDIEGPNVLYEKHIPSELCTGIISVHFDTCSFHGFEKNVLLVATRDSSILAFDSDGGSTLSATAVRPKKPSKALFMQILDVSDVQDVGKGKSAEIAIPKQSLLLLCNEKAVYLYSLTHAVQGIKKVQYKKKFHGTCCWASTIYDHNSGVALALLFTSGNIEIRLPELSLMKETNIRGLTFSNSKSCSFSDTLICASSDGELVLVNGDQEVIFVSLLLRKETYRFLDHISLVYKEGVMDIQETPVFNPVHKEKKKGMFSFVINDKKGSKAKHDSEPTTEDSRSSVADELSTIFSTANFPLDNGNREHPAVDNDETELSIDDIDLEDTGEEKHKGHNLISALNTQKLTSKFQALKGKLKQKMVKNEKSHAKAENEVQNTDSVDDIKRRYGFPSSSESTEVKLAENKLHENLKKLQDINTRTTEMQDTARSFSAMAKEVLRTTEKDGRSS